MKLPTVITVAAAFVGCSEAFWRMECRGRVGLARIDPIISPGEVSQHVHAIHGSSGFSETAQYTDVINGNCTSCAVTQDKSAYWHPALYFRHDNGSYELVPQTGGMLAYYFLNPTPGEEGNITAFPEGFRMIAGNSTRRTYNVANDSYLLPDPGQSEWAALNQTTQSDLSQRALGFNCLDYAKAVHEGSLYRHYLPDKDYLDANCVNGVRFEIMFPSCWNGKDLDSPDHKSHVAYPDLVMQGYCPAGYDVRLPGLFYETIWETDTFKGSSGEFVISNGDIQGFGYHADFIMGWNGTFLQEAVDTCTNSSGRIEDCPIFDIQSEANETSCQLETLPQQLVNEAVTGIVGNSLPGDVQILYGPETGTQVSPAPPTSIMSVSNLGFSPGSTPANSGSVVPGEVFKQTTSSSPSPAAMPTSASPSTAEASSASDASPNASSAPTLTTAASTAAPAENSMSVLSTQYITSGNTVSEIVWEEAVVYVTESEDFTVTTTVQPSPSVPAVNKLRRGHGHDHFHRHLRHGGRR